MCIRDSVLGALRGVDGPFQGVVTRDCLLYTSNPSETARLYGGTFLEKHASDVILKYIESMESVLIRVLKENGFHAPLPFRELVKLTDGIISTGDKMGEGWLLTAEMIELVRAGYENIVCAQPFGCLPNHICGKGMINKIRELYPQANITPIDYDPSATRAVSYTHLDVYKRQSRRGSMQLKEQGAQQQCSKTVSIVLASFSLNGSSIP